MLLGFLENKGYLLDGILHVFGVTLQESYTYYKFMHREVDRKLSVGKADQKDIANNKKSKASSGCFELS